MTTLLSTHLIASISPAGGDLSAAESAMGDAVSALPSVFELAMKGGVMMIPIVICSLVALAVVVERLVVLRRNRIQPPAFLPNLAPHLPKPGASARAAIEHCDAAGTPIARVIGAGLRRLGSPVEHIEHAIADAGAREALAMRKHLRVLSVIAAVAPLMGLLGTILGMIVAFRTVAGAGDALGRTELLAEGIYEAMITTAAGLMVAIPALLAYHWLSARVQRLVAGLDTASIELVENLGVLPEPIAPSFDRGLASDERGETRRGDSGVTTASTSSGRNGEVTSVVATGGVA